MAGQRDIKGVRSQHDVELDRVRTAYTRRREASARRQAATGRGGRYTHFNPGNLLLIQERERAILHALSEAGCFPISQKDILEVGCGSGYWLRQFIQWGADPTRIHGLELLPQRALAARHRCPAGVRILIGDGARAPLISETFDLVCQFTVFTSILDETMRRDLASEMLRLVRHDGLILWCDLRYNNPFNKDVAGIGAREIRRLFPGREIRLRSLTLAPFLARTLAPWSWWLCETLNLMPFLRTHLLGVISRSV